MSEARARGMCPACYAYWKAWGEVRPSRKVSRRRRQAALCTVDGCDRVRRARLMCDRHYAMWNLRRERGVCSSDGCERPAKTKGLCYSHYAKLRASDPNSKRCCIVGCKRAAMSRGMCPLHWKRDKMGTPMDARIVSKSAPLEKRPHPSGYVMVYAGPYKAKLEHRVVMERVVGRPLLRTESVHHINGIKNDNRPENLELWSKSQPSGQRVIDKVRWAREILSLYGALYPDAREAIAAE